MEDIVLFSGTAHPDLAASVARILNQPLCPSDVQVFPDGEITVNLKESVRGRQLFIVQPTAHPVTQNVFELLLFVDAC